MSSRQLVRVTVAGPAGRLEGLLHRPAGSPRFAAVVSHPHPLWGGTMDNRVVYRIARALEDASGLVLRFNFRGAGGSDGVHDEGRGEADDLRAAVSFVRQQDAGSMPLLLAGFSFGAVMSVLVGCADESVDGLLLVGVPVSRHGLEELVECAKPVAFIQGDRDEHGPLANLQGVHDRMRGPRTLRVIAGAGHFFEGGQAELAAAVREAVEGGVLASVVGMAP